MADDTSSDIPDNLADVSLIDPLPEGETPEAEAPNTDTSESETTHNDESDAENKQEAETTEAKDTEATPEDTQEQPETQAEKGKPDPALAYKAYQERQRTKQAVEQQIDQVYGPKTQEQLEEEGIDPVQAQVQALREEMIYNQQRAQIAELNAGMQAEAVNAMNDFPVFNEKSPEYDKDFTEMVQRQYQTAARLQTDENGIILNADIPLYDFYKSMNDIYTRGSSKGASQAQAEAMQVLSRTEEVGGSSSVNKGPETLEEMAERLGDIVIT